MSADFPYKESFIFRNNLGSNRKDANNNMFYNTTKKTWDCGLCRRGFKEKLDLEQHLSSGTHDAIKFSCSQCGKGFASLGALTLHVEQAEHVSTYQKLSKDIEVLAAAAAAGGGSNLYDNNNSTTQNSNNTSSTTGITNALYRKVDSFPLDSHYQQQQQQLLLREGNVNIHTNNNSYGGSNSIVHENYSNGNNGNLRQMNPHTQQQQQLPQQMMMNNRNIQQHNQLLNHDDRYRQQQQNQNSLLPYATNNNMNNKYSNHSQQQQQQHHQLVQNPRGNNYSERHSIPVLSSGFNPPHNSILSQQQSQQQAQQQSQQIRNGHNNPIPSLPPHHMLNHSVPINNFPQQQQQLYVSSSLTHPHSHQSSMSENPSASAYYQDSEQPMFNMMTVNNSSNNTTINHANHSCVLYFAGYSERNAMEAGCCFTLIDEDISYISSGNSSNNTSNTNSTRSVSDTTTTTGDDYSNKSDITTPDTTTTTTVSVTAAVNPNKTGKVIADDAFVINQYYPSSIQPEYEGLFEGLTRASEMNLLRLTIICDSELLYNHLMSGSNSNNNNNRNKDASSSSTPTPSSLFLQSVYRIVNPLFAHIQQLLQEFRHISVKLVTQDENKYMRTIAKSMFFKAKGIFEEIDVMKDVSNTATTTATTASGRNNTMVSNGIASLDVNKVNDDDDDDEVKKNGSPTSIATMTHMNINNHHKLSSTANATANAGVMMNENDKCHIYRDILQLHKSKLQQQQVQQSTTPPLRDNQPSRSLTPSLPPPLPHSHSLSSSSSSQPMQQIPMQHQSQPSKVASSLPSLSPPNTAATSTTPTFTTFNTFNLTKNYNTISSDSPLHAHSPFIHSSLTQQSPLKEYNVYLQNAMYSLATPQRAIMPPPHHHHGNGNRTSNGTSTLGNMSEYNAFHNPSSSSLLHQPSQAVYTSRSEDNATTTQSKNGSGSNNNGGMNFTTNTATTMSEKGVLPYVVSNNHRLINVDYNMSSNNTNNTNNTNRNSLSSSSLFTQSHSLTLAQSLLQHGVEVSNGSNTKVTDIPITNSYFNNNHHHQQSSLNHADTMRMNGKNNSNNTHTSSTAADEDNVLNAYQQHLLECDCRTDINGMPCQFHHHHHHGEKEEEEVVVAMTPMQTHLHFLKNQMMMSAGSNTGNGSVYKFDNASSDSNKSISNNNDDDTNINSFFNMSIYDE